MEIVHNNADYASRGVGNAALTTGIIGTAGFGLNLLGALGGNSILGNARSTCSEDHFINRYEAGQQARIAELETEVKLRDANTYTDQKLIEMYKYFDGETKQIKQDLCDMKAQQGVINANFMAGIDVLKSQAADTRGLVASITQTVVPQSSVCNTCTPCNSCCGNV